MAQIVQVANSMVKNVDTFFKTQVRDPEHLKTWITYCSRNIQLINRAAVTGENIGVKNNLLAAVAKMQGYRTLLKAMETRGGGYAPARPNRLNWTKNRVKWEDLKSVFAGRIRTGVFINLVHKDPLAFLEECGPMFVRRLTNEVRKDAFIKVNTTFCGKFIKVAGNEEIEELNYMNTKNNVITCDTNISEWYALNVMIPIMEQLEEFQERESGWALSAVVNLVVNINKYTPQLGNSWIDLPAQIKNKKACINVQNDDDACFAWAVTSALHPDVINNNRMTSYLHYSAVLNLDGITFPINREQITKFEDQNAISINVYVLNKKKNNYLVSPSRLTKNKVDKHVNLLLVQSDYFNEDEEEEGIDNAAPVRYHYVWIKNLSRLISTQMSLHGHRTYLCDRCLHYFHTAQKLAAHLIDCEKMNEYKINLRIGGTIKFKNFKNKERCPFIVYADFESILKSVKIKFGQKGEKFQEHEAHSVGYYVKCAYDDSLSFYRSYRGLNCTEWFASELEQLAEDVETVFMCAIQMDTLTPDQNTQFRDATKCHICEKPLGPKRVRDHCHLTGQFRGAAHAKCNLEYEDSRTIPVVFHNFSGYDSHLLLKDVAQKIAGRMYVIPNNTEKFISMIKNVDHSLVKFKFLDSLRFMASSLDKLASYLDEKPTITAEFSQYDADKIRLLTRKGVFPYDHIRNWESLDETKLPTRKQFNSKLNESEISEADYDHALNVWREFGIQTLGENSDLYLKTDVLLLADVFEAFRAVCLKNYGLDAAHYFTAPGLSWDAMLKKTGIELDMIDDVDILMFFEKGIRGGLTQCSKRHAKANNQYARNYKPDEPSNFLMYYDINAMYAWAMSQYLPSGYLKWVEGDVSNFNFNKPDDSPIGYVLEVDLEYPQHIHDRQSDLPMAPGKDRAPGSKQAKMLATLFSKEKYVVHYRNLKQYVSEGLIVTKIHRVLQFKQSAWLKNYIDLNADLRRQSRNEFEKNFFKLMSNAVFGKTMENVRNRRMIKLLTKWEGRYGAEAMIAKPSFHNSTIIADDLVMIELLKTEVLFNKPIYVGMCILDISKTSLYEFHYSYMNNKYGGDCTLCYTDTDSLIYDVRTEDVYADIKEDIARFDTSDYDPANPYGIPLANKKIPGLMKDENSGKVMEEFVGLRAKMYACRVREGNDTKKAKGVKGYVVKNKITFEDYLECLNDRKEFVHQQNSIRSFNHRLFSNFSS